MKRILLLVTCLLCARGASGAELARAAAPASPYAKWEHGPSHDAGFFPIAVWLQDPRNAGQYRAAGFNTYVGLWKGPTESQLAALKAAGMKVICEQNATARIHLDDPTIIGWMHGDEAGNSDLEGTDGKPARGLESGGNESDLRAERNRPHSSGRPDHHWLDARGRARQCPVTRRLKRLRPADPRQEHRRGLSEAPGGRSVAAGHAQPRPGRGLGWMAW